MKNKRIIIANILTVIILLILYFWNEKQTGWDALGTSILTLMIIIPLIYFIFGIVSESSKTKFKYTYLLTGSIFIILFGYYWENRLYLGYTMFCIIPVFLGMATYEIVRLIKQKISVKKDIINKDEIKIDKIPIIITIILIILTVLYFIIFNTILL